MKYQLSPRIVADINTDGSVSFYKDGALEITEKFNLRQEVINLLTYIYDEDFDFVQNETRITFFVKRGASDWSHTIVLGDEDFSKVTQVLISTGYFDEEDGTNAN